MKKRVILTMITGLLMYWQAMAQVKPQYAVSAIPDSLRQNVNSVIREQSDIIVMKSPGRGKQIVKKVVTVFNEKDEDELTFFEFYDRFRKIDDIEINVYDENGKYLKRSRKRDLQNTRVNDGESLMNDDWVVYTSLKGGKFPITIEINYEINYLGNLEFDDFIPQAPDQSIIQKSYSITTSNDNKVRFKNYRCNVQPTVKTEGNATTLTWEVKNIKPYIKEPGSAKEDYPRVLISPTQFEMDDYAGRLDTWENYGKWSAEMKKGIDKLKKQKIPFYQELVKNAQTDREKVAILYKHLQENYRYVGIQLGIGGFKPFPADFVEEKKYGDCKGLANLMTAMLDAVNIKSYYTIINSGYNSMPLIKDFPQNQFNHIIVCVPLPKDKDTVWLECTSRTLPFGSLSPSTENRYGLMVTENGGVLAATPRSKPDENVYDSKTVIKLNENGSGSAEVNIHHKGVYTEISNYLFDSEEQTRKSYLIHRQGFKQPDELLMEKKDEKNRNDYIAHYEMTFEKIPEFSAGAKHFLSGRLYKFWNDALPKTEHRQNDYYLDFPLIKTDTTIYQLPEGFIAENLPASTTIKSGIGTFKSSYLYNADKREVMTVSNIRIETHVVPALQYEETAKFFSDILKEQQQKIIAKKQ